MSAEELICCHACRRTFLAIPLDEPKHRKEIHVVYKHNGKHVSFWDKIVAVEKITVCLQCASPNIQPHSSHKLLSFLLKEIHKRNKK